MNQRFLDVNRHGVLSPPASFWWCSALLLRYWSLLLCIAASVIVQSPVDWAYGVLAWPMLLAEIPMLALLCSASQRVPTAGSWPRAIWRHGRELIALTVVLSVGVMVWSLAGQDTWRPVPERLMALLAMAEASVAIAFWRSPLYRALFAEFPAAAELTPTTSR